MRARHQKEFTSVRIRRQGYSYKGGWRISFPGDLSNREVPAFKGLEAGDWVRWSCGLSFKFKLQRRLWPQGLSSLSLGTSLPHETKSPIQTADSSKHRFLILFCILQMNPQCLGGNSRCLINVQKLP